jgi:hypothetical protein
MTQIKKSFTGRESELVETELSGGLKKRVWGVNPNRFKETTPPI